MAGQVDHDAPRKLVHAHRSQVPYRARDVLLEPTQKEGTVAALEADLVVVNDDARPAGDHVSDSGRLGGLGGRRYTVFGTSVLGGVRGMGLRAPAGRGFFRLTGARY